MLVNWLQSSEGEIVVDVLGHSVRRLNPQMDPSALGLRLLRVLADLTTEI